MTLAAAAGHAYDTGEQKEKNQTVVSDASGASIISPWSASWHCGSRCNTLAGCHHLTYTRFGMTPDAFFPRIKKAENRRVREGPEEKRVKSKREGGPRPPPAVGKDQTKEQRCHHQ